MDPNIIQLLQSQEHGKLGCILALAQGYTYIDIIDNMVNEDRYPKYNLKCNDCQLLISKHYDEMYYYVIYDYTKGTVTSDNDRYKNGVEQEDYDKVTDKYFKMFIDLIVNGKYTEDETRD